MQRVEFEEAVEQILEKDSRYQGDAYLFLRDALDFTLKDSGESESKENRHVSGPELLEGFRDYALNEFGPMVMTVLEEWGVHECRDVGEMVFNLIGVGVFGKTANDRKEDFEKVFDFDEAFRAPYLPDGASESRGPGAVTEGGSSSIEPRTS